MKPYKILFFSTNGLPAQKLKEEFVKSGIQVKETQYIETARKELHDDTFDAVIYRCERAADADILLLQKLRGISQDIPVIMTVKKGDVTSTVHAIKSGANDLIVAPSLDSTIIDAILRNVDGSKNNNDVSSQPTISEISLIGKSLAIEEVKSAIDLVANSHTAVMITGESGTGKEVVARLIHLKSDRSRQPFIALNCAALPKDIIENELFGHERGAFTGALKKKEGNFEAANGGTLFFDEIAEMNPDTQAKLLRVIEQKAFRRLGGDKEIHVDVRTIAATNKNIHDAMSNGEFRQDLYYRFSVIEIHMPPLRERKEDIPLLIDHFFPIFKEKHNRPERHFREDTLELLKQYEWPGNVRELRNVIERVVVTSSADAIAPEELPLTIKKSETNSVYVNIPLGTTYREAERMLLIKTLAYAKNNKSRTAKLLGVSRKTLHNKLHEFGLTQNANAAT
ncbi:MAG: sigma-54-dependent Fis family transcriptional regulator [Ignavibacteriales bacterium]|nr:sigma-54-dependent Fis family transcriptional regulator [Ignavibacteriales bacterium]